MKNYRLGLLLVGLIVIVVLGGGIYIYAGKNAAQSEQGNQKKSKKDKKSKKNKDKNSGEEIVATSPEDATCVGGKLIELESWEMPQELFEISSIAWIGSGKIAGVQDQKGIIYIYNLATKRVEKRIGFGPDGDYEGLSYVGGHYFVMRSDGHMLEVDLSGKVIKQYDLPLSAKDNIEPFYYDGRKNRLLLGQKDGEKGASKKSFFAFDLSSRKFDPRPVYAIDLNDPIVACGNADESESSKGKKSGKKKGKGSGATIRPSEIVIYPKTKEILIADGPNHRILVLSPEGKPKHYLLMDQKSFPQVEGMLFAPNGDFYISTEGAKGPAKISKMRIELK